MNCGIYLGTSATLTAGATATYSASPNIINLSGTGGTGSDGSTTATFHCGVYVAGSNVQVNLNGTHPYNALNFINCLGGSGYGGQNCGVYINSNLTLANATMNFTNCVGGNGYGIGGGVNGAYNCGVYINANISATSILATDCYGGIGGLGATPDFIETPGLIAFIGSSATHIISISAGSLGVNVNENGINIGGTLQVGDGGTISLFGTGGGLYYTNSLSNSGVTLYQAKFIAGATANYSASPNTINITGYGGTGLGGFHYGAYQNAVTVTMNGINPGNSFNFINCTGGSGGGSNFGSVSMRHVF